MNIKEVSERTGLTKKAIKFYENAKLLQVKKNPDNNYRMYTQEDINVLNLISSLRLLNIPIVDIKKFIDGKIDISNLLSNQMKRINIEFEKIYQEKILTQTVMENLDKLGDFPQVVKKLEETLNLSEIEKQQYLTEQLKRIFPGEFGAFIASVYEPFLEIKMNNNNTENWMKLIKVLDDMEEIPLSHPVMNLITNNIKDKLDLYLLQNRNFIEKIIEKDKSTWNNLKNQILNLVNGIKNDPAFKEKFIKQSQLAENVPSLKEGSNFSELLYSISPKYQKFVDYQLEIKKEADVELGFDSQKFLRSLIH